MNNYPFPSVQVLADLFRSFISFPHNLRVREENKNIFNEVCSFTLQSTCKYNPPVLYGGGSECELKVGNCYRTCGEVFSIIKTVCSNNFHPMRIGQCNILDRNNEDYYYKWFDYVCKHHGKYVSKSKGKRPKQKSNCLECPACISCRLHLRPNPHYRITRVNLEHNHAISSELYSLYPEQRTLNLEEREFLKDVLVCKAVKCNDIRRFIQSHFGKKVPLTDVHNLRAWHKSNFSTHDCSEHEAFSMDVLAEEWRSQKEEGVQISSGLSKVGEAVFSVENTMDITNTFLNLEGSSNQEINEIDFSNVDSEMNNSDIQREVSCNRSTSNEPDNLEKFKHAKIYTDKLACCLSRCVNSDFDKKLEILNALLQIWERKEKIVLCKEDNGLLEVHISDLKNSFESENISTENILTEVMENVNKSCDDDTDICDLNTEANSGMGEKCENSLTSVSNTDHLGGEIVISSCPENENYFSKDKVFCEENCQSFKGCTLQQSCNTPVSDKDPQESVITRNFSAENMAIVSNMPQLQFQLPEPIDDSSLAGLSHMCTKIFQNGPIFSAESNTTIILPKNIELPAAKNSQVSSEARTEELSTNMEIPSKKRLFCKRKKSNQSCKSEEQSKKRQSGETFTHLKGKIDELKNITLIKKLHNYTNDLTEKDMNDIKCNCMLSDKIINVGQVLINLKFPRASGLQDVLLGNSLKFKTINSEFVQIIHCKSYPHWITVSTLRAPPAVVYVYDSVNECIPRDAVPQICNIMNVQTSQLCAISKSMQVQSNNVDCGLFALACAMTLLSGKDPSDVVYDTSKMRQHLSNALMTNDLSEFPTLNPCDVPRTLGRIENFPLHCFCRQPLLKKISFQNLKQVYQCKFCEKWYHRQCKESCCGTNVLRVSISGVDCP